MALGYCIRYQGCTHTVHTVPKGVQKQIGRSYVQRCFLNKISLGPLEIHDHILPLYEGILCMNTGTLCMHDGMVCPMNAIDMLEMLCMLRVFT